MEPLSFKRLLPAAATTDARAFIADLPFAERSSGRPYTVVNFVASVDGHTTVEGRSRELGDDGDRDLFRALREASDAILTGTNTMGAEHYGRALASRERRERRLARGRSAEPLLVSISRSGDFPAQIPLFSEPESRVVLFSPEPPRLEGTRAEIRHEQLSPAAGSPLTDALTTLYRTHGVRLLLCEGGPTLFNALLHEGLVDELFLSVYPRLVGGSEGPALTTGVPLLTLGRLLLKGAMERDGTLFLRYAVSAGGA